MSLVAGNNININDSSAENTEANKKHDARDQSSSATPWSLTPSHCCFYKLTTLPLKGAVSVNKNVHACVYIQSLFLPLFIYTYAHTHVYILQNPAFFILKLCPLQNIGSCYKGHFHTSETAAAGPRGAGLERSVAPRPARAARGLRCSGAMQGCGRAAELQHDVCRRDPCIEEARITFQQQHQDN